jgi:hypothetical protein
VHAYEVAGFVYHRSFDYIGVCAALLVEVSLGPGNDDAEADALDGQAPSVITRANDNPPHSSESLSWIGTYGRLGAEARGVPRWVPFSRREPGGRQGQALQHCTNTASGGKATTKKNWGHTHTLT